MTNHDVWPLEALQTRVHTIQLDVSSLLASTRGSQLHGSCDRPSCFNPFTNSTAAPGARAHAYFLRKDAREMALVSKAGLQGNVRERVHPIIHQIHGVHGSCLKALARQRESDAIVPCRMRADADRRLRRVGQVGRSLGARAVPRHGAAASTRFCTSCRGYEPPRRRKGDTQWGASRARACALPSPKPSTEAAMPLASVCVMR